MFGTLIGDFVGSTYEFHPIYSRYFDLFSPRYTFTDDSVLTAAVSQAFMYQENLRQNLVNWTLKHRRAGYGKNYFQWAYQQSQELNNEIGDSWGNGCLMRNSPSILLSSTLAEALNKSQTHCELTHNHPDALAITQVYTEIIFKTLEFAKQQYQSHSQLSRFIEKSETHLIKERKNFFFDLVHKNNLVFEKVEEYCMGGFKVDAKSTLPIVLAVLWEAQSFEEVLRHTVFIGGDTDTNAAIAGYAAEVIFGIPEDMLKDFLAYSQMAGPIAIDVLPVIAASYLNSPHKNYFLAKPGYLSTIEKILVHEKQRISKTNASQ